MPISVLIPALNEEKNLPGCLASVAWSDDVVVVDSGSRDNTATIVAAHGARLVTFDWNRRLPKKKNWALANVEWKHDWVLILDADEHITPELAAEMQAAVRGATVDGFYINRRFMFLGAWIRHCGYYPSWNLRLIRRGRGRYEDLVDGDSGSGDNEVHEHVLLDGPSGHLRHDMLHYAYPDIHTWMEKHNRYSNWEARMEVNGPSGPAGALGQGLGTRRRLRLWSRRLPFRPLLRFFYSYVLKLGFLDGRVGYVFCRLLATYELLNVVKAYELRRASRRGGQPRP